MYLAQRGRDGDTVRDRGSSEIENVTAIEMFIYGIWLSSDEAPFDLISSIISGDLQVSVLAVAYQLWQKKYLWADPQFMVVRAG